MQGGASALFSFENSWYLELTLACIRGRARGCKAGSKLGYFIKQGSRQALE